MRQPISGQLSGAELALEEQVDDLINSPRFQPDRMTGSAAGYALLKEDLKMRAMQNRDLAEQQELAFKSSSRRHMANEISLQNQKTEKAKLALAQISASVNEDGLAEQDAISLYFKNNPEEILNETTVMAMRPFMAMNEDPYDRFMRQNGEKLAKSKILNENFNAEFALKQTGWKMENIDKLKEILDLGLEQQRHALEPQIIESKIRKLKGQAAWNFYKNETIPSMNVLRKAAGGEPVDENLFLKARSTMAKNGVSLRDGGRTMYRNRPSVDSIDLGFLADQRSINKLSLQMAGGDEAESMAIRNQLTQALADLDDPELHAEAQGQGQSAVDAQKRIAEANRIIDEGKLVFFDEHQDRLVQQQTEETLKANSEAMLEPYTQAVGLIRQNLTEADKGKSVSFIRAHKSAKHFLKKMAASTGRNVSSELSPEEKIAAIKTKLPRFKVPDQFSIEKNREKLSGNPVFAAAEFVSDGLFSDSESGYTQKGLDLIDSQGEKLGLWLVDSDLPEPPSEKPDKPSETIDYERVLINAINDRVKILTVPAFSRDSFFKAGSFKNNSGDVEFEDFGGSIPSLGTAQKPQGASSTSSISDADFGTREINNDLDFIFQGTDLNDE